MNQAQVDLLVIDVQSGDINALNELCRYFHQPLLRFAFSIVNDPNMAKDAVQDAMLNITSKIMRLQDPRAFKSWLFRQVKWRALDQLKSKKRLNEVSDSAVNLDELTQLAQDTTHQAQTTQLDKLLNQLPALDRESLYLFYYEEMKINEIAIVLEIPEGTVKSRLNRGRNQLKSLWQSAEE